MFHRRIILCSAPGRMHIAPFFSRSLQKTFAKYQFSSFSKVSLNDIFTIVRQSNGITDPITLASSINPICTLCQYSSSILTRSYFLKISERRSYFVVGKYSERQEESNSPIFRSLFLNLARGAALGSINSAWMYLVKDSFKSASNLPLHRTK